MKHPRNRILLVILCVWLGHTAQVQAKTPYTTKYDLYFWKYSRRYFGPFFDWHLFKAQAIAESGLQAGARSRTGARGIMQLLPSTWKEIRTKNPELKSIDNPGWNIAAGIYYVRTHWRAWDRIIGVRERLAFTFGSYNAGRGRIHQARQVAIRRYLSPDRWENLVRIGPYVPGWRFRETVQYIDRIESYYFQVSPHPVFMLPRCDKSK